MHGHFSSMWDWRHSGWWTLLWCGVLSTLTAQSVQAEWRGTSHAVVIGINTYRDPTWPTLSYAVKDAKGIESFSRSQRFEVHRLLNEEATKSRILSLFYELARRV